MNITESEKLRKVIAKTITCVHKNNKINTRNVTYFFVDAYHCLCREKEGIVLPEVQAYESLRNTSDNIDIHVRAMDLDEPKEALVLLP